MTKREGGEGETLISFLSVCFMGIQCLSSGSLTFRCPGGCATQLIYNPRAIGNLLPDLVPLVIGGGEEPPIYRAE